jgi:hypothetical protein
MRFMLLICNGTATTAGPPAADFARWVADHDVIGARLVGSRLGAASDATTVRVRGDQTLVTDGPFAESHEQIAGFDVIECADMDEAVRIAAAHPAARQARVEIRELRSLDFS